VVAQWASEYGQIIKSELSNSRGNKAIPPMVEFV